MDDRVKAKLQSLLAKANDPAATSDEALGAMTMVHKLMEKHGVGSLEELQAKEGDDFIGRSWAGRQSAKHGAVFHPVDRLCCKIIARFCGVRYWYVQQPSGAPNEREAEFFGLEADVALAEWMRANLITHFDHDWEIFRQTGRENRSLKHLPSARQSFALGFAGAFEERMADWLYRTQQADPDGNGSTSLVFQKQDAIGAELARRGITVKTKAYSGPSVTDGIAAGAGFNAGKSAKLNNDIGQHRPVIAITG